MSELSVKCPMCAKQILWSKKNPYRPFCSERCRILDLGDWADGKRSIAADAENDDVTAKDLDIE